ncbi:aspartate/glutamate racemase family protein [Paenibacillus lycopersici]|uniref:Aspartate/glutamate racemase family protein n=1 Tax=Paenibacillus lycopersici TaxID=2704462 RepID=A0A6C0G3A5_9BACL|nr:aspartate/glutamate racemase family protein [Paenibacillus lycopersici]QHT61120.1 aspartate/glutamate racemase family protein [Paenibacillus lycopersici]
MALHKLAIIHTTPVTIDPLKAVAAEYLPGWELINFVDDSILPELIRNEGMTETVIERWLAYAKYAEQQGAACIVSACSSVGEVAEMARQVVKVPVLRIDEAMAEEAVSSGRRIGVAASLATTLQPTIRLIERKAEQRGEAIELKPALAAEAYRLLMSGDKEGHDRVLAASLLELIESVDVVVLAQASMARVVASLPEGLQSKFLASPRLGMAYISRIAAGADHAR